MSMDDLQTLQEELEQLKKQCEQAAKQKTFKKIEKQKANEKCDELEKELDEVEATRKKLQDALKEQQARFKVNSQLPAKNINFKETLTTAENRSDDEPMDITYTCYLTSGRPFILGAGQALLTFEEERVARSVIAKKRHSLEGIDGGRNVEALQPQLDKSVKFEVRMDISRKKLKISNLPEDIPEETLKDKVELTFYKSSIGGAEIEEVEYDRNDNTAYVTYLQNGVAQRVLKSPWHQFMAGEVTCEVEVMPCVKIELNKLQMFFAASPRSVLLTGIKNVDEDGDDVQDLIQIHFQKESNGGGEVESTEFCQDKGKTLIFEEDLK
uniref:N-myc-interactor n=1 Tax=Aquarana catesbeiana TaxID=8400 RepID=C1C3Q6_AQUCT|nr:N-myc-interactor [Aquarana catesbeiana]